MKSGLLVSLETNSSPYLQSTFYSLKTKKYSKTHNFRPNGNFGASIALGGPGSVNWAGGLGAQRVFLLVHQVKEGKGHLLAGVAALGQVYLALRHSRVGTRSGEKVSFKPRTLFVPRKWADSAVKGGRVWCV